MAIPAGLGTNADDHSVRRTNSFRDMSSRDLTYVYDDLLGMLSYTTTVTFAANVKPRGSLVPRYVYMRSGNDIRKGRSEISVCPPRQYTRLTVSTGTLYLSTYHRVPASAEKASATLPLRGTSE
jgi:hypothetical protein